MHQYHYSLKKKQGNWQSHFFSGQVSNKAYEFFLFFFFYKEIEGNLQIGG